MISNIEDEITRIDNYYRTNKNNHTTELKVAFYTRVSTEHDAQINALENQEAWCIDLLKSHPNWKLVKIYTDKGITGTMAKKRAGFLEAINDGKNKKYQLLICRDVSRFARNAEESLRYSHFLKKYGVEIFFYNDGIWSLDSDGDLRLGLMSIFAQDESRKISERVKAGQHISRQKHVLYGTGNILGYSLVRGEKPEDNTYEIDEEQAETVRMIFRLYLEGKGTKKIASELLKAHRKNASGEVKWDVCRVSRVLDNRTYAGYIGYKKSITKDFLEHSRAKNKKSEYEYVKGNFEPIISDEDWKMAQKIKRENTITVRGKTLQGKKPAKDIWVKKLRCSCGSTYKRYKWRTNASGEEVFGYQCGNQVRNRKAKFYEQQGLPTEGLCDLPSICMWKLDFQLRCIIQKLYKNPKRIVNTLVKVINENYVEEQTKRETPDNSRLLREKKRLEIRIQNLLELRLDGELSKDEYNNKKEEYSIRLAEIEQELHKKEIEEEVNTLEIKDKEEILKDINSVLNKSINLKTKFLDEELIESIVELVFQREAGVFDWYLKFGMDDLEKEFSTDDYIKYTSFTIEFDEAREYRKKYGNFMRRSKWNDLKVNVFIKI